MQTENELADYIVKRTKETWDEKSQPYYLSKISTELSPQQIYYKEIIGDRTLKEFAGSLNGDVKLVMHPTSKSKVGLVPANQPFRFIDEVSTSSSPVARVAQDRDASMSTTRQATIRFLQALSTLSDDDLNDIVIPVRVLARLMS